MLEAYLDESGIHKGAVFCVVAGYFGRKSQWKWFERRWRSVLIKHGLKLEEFHAKDIVNHTRYAALVAELAETIARYHLYPITAAIVVGDFLSFNEKQRRWITGATLAPNGTLVTSGAPNKPYFVPFQLCLRMVTEHTPVGEKAHFFFGIDRPMSKYANALFAKIQADRAYAAGWPEKKRLGDPAYPLAAQTPQLQAADLLVHLSYKHMLERHREGKWLVKASPVLELCIKRAKRDRDLMFQNKQCLDEMLAKSYGRFGRWIPDPTCSCGNP